MKAKAFIENWDIVKICIAWYMVFIKPTQDFSVACLFRRSLLSRDKVQSEITVLCYADPFSKCTGYSGWRRNAYETIDDADCYHTIKKIT